MWPPEATSSPPRLRTPSSCVESQTESLLVSPAPADALQTVRLYKSGGTIRLMVDDIVSAAFDDDGKAFGPVWTNPGWIGLRQMAHTIRCEYDDIKVFPVKP